jgi:hypothetical protein
MGNVSTVRKGQKMGLSEDRIPSDPKAREAWEEAKAKLDRTQTDQRQAKIAGDAEKKTKDQIAKRDAEVIAEREAREASAEARYAKEQATARSRYLAKPPTQNELDELEQLEAMARSGILVPPDTMRRLSELRTKAALEKKPK